MAADEKSLQILYFYNALSEFMYFIILYIESYGFVFLTTLTKHIKFFKAEVGELLSSLAGDSTEQKLHQLLIVMNCFKVTENKLQANEMTVHLKDTIFECLLLSKTVDLVLRGCTNVNDICKNVNFCNVISIDQKNLLKILKKTTHLSVQRNRFLSLNHFHGILGYEDYFSNHVINYFQNILQDVRKLTLDDIQCHAKCFSSCGSHSILSILCILYCSKHFHFENGNIMLSKKSGKHCEQKPLDLNLVCKSISKAAMAVGPIVFSAYGPHLHNWTGEICSLTENCGFIYCIIDFTNGNHGIFKIYFNQFALKIISEVPNLKQYFRIRDVVQFDASYHYYSETFDFWKATRVKIVNAETFNYNEHVFTELVKNSKTQRTSCIEYMHRLGSGKDFSKCFYASQTDETSFKHLEIKGSEKSVLNKNLTASDNADYVYKKSHYFDNQIANIHLKNVKSQNIIKPVSNFLLTDFLFVFGRVVMLMEDKGIAVFKQSNLLYNILFVKSAIYPTTKSLELFYKGQKIFAIIPYIEKIDATVVAALVYGLSNDETDCFLNPQEFAKSFLLTVFSPSMQKFGENSCSVVNSLIYQPDCYSVDLKMQSKLLKLHDFMLSLSVCKVKSFSFKKAVVREYVSNESNKEITSFIIKLSKILKRKCDKSNKLQAKFKKMLKRVRCTSHRKCDTKNYALLSNSSCRNQSTEIEKQRLSPKNIALTSKSPDFIKGSYSSLSSYKSLDSLASSETFFSCASTESCSKKTDCTSQCNELNSHAETHSLFNEAPQLLFSPEPNSKTPLMLIEDFDENPGLKSHHVKCMCKKREKIIYFYLQSFPLLKNSFISKRKILCVPNSKALNDESCCIESFKVAASVALITETFFFFNVNIDGEDIVLPLPRRVIPIELQQSMKLNSCSNITLVPNTLMNLSHILSVEVIP